MNGKKKRIQKENRRAIAFLIVVSVLCCVLAYLPTPYPAKTPENATRERVRVLSTNNTQLAPLGIVYSGVQEAEVEILSGAFKGKTTAAANHLNAALDKDKLFEAGDIALAMIQERDGEPLFATLIDHYRADVEGWILLLFGVLLALLGGLAGLGALLSLVASVLLIWKGLIPLLLMGAQPIAAAFLLVALLTLMIMLLVAGFTRRAFVAFSGSMLGTALTCALTILFGRMLRLNGGSIPYAVPLIAQGGLQLDLQQLFFAMVFLGNSGALMDLAMDIASACDEICLHKPDITRRELIRSGFSVGRSVIGTMTTTLMLAYSGSYLSMLMYFMGQGTPVTDILNYQFVSSEILITLVGSMGLVTVAPFTALMAGAYVPRRKRKDEGTGAIEIPDEPHVRQEAALKH